jgi:flagellar hook protein FlgE
MSLFGALSASLTNLTAQSSAVNVISNNIANLNTTGYKNNSTSFATLVTGNTGGGVLQTVRQNIGAQGSITSTNVGTDLAMQGSGFFVVKDLSGNMYYTRAGSFRTDQTGNLVNESGYLLQGWPLDSQGRLPGEAGNLNTRSNQDLGSLATVSTSDITGKASPTTSISTKLNLNAGETVLPGAGGSTLFPSNSNNSGLSSTAIIVPAGFTVGTTISVSTNNGTNVAGTYAYGGFTSSGTASVGTPIFGAANANQSFSGLTDGESFTIYTESLSAPVTFTYKPVATTSARQFSSLSDLATAIESVTGLTARIVNNQLYVAPSNAQDSLTFVNNPGNTNDIVAGLGVANTTPQSGRFASLKNLADLVNNTNGISASITSATNNASLTIFNDDPTDTVQFSDSDAGDALLTGLGLPSTAIAAVYAPDDVTGTRSMASGNVSADFSRTVTVYTSLGNPLDLRIAYSKTGINEWAVELYAANPSEVSAPYPNGLLAFGTVEFNSDGSLNSVSSNATQLGARINGDITINPTGGASPLTVTVFQGTAGALGDVIADGLSQYTGSYTVDRVFQDGAPTGRLQSLQIDAQGFVTAVFDNSLTQRVYKLPVAYFANPNGLAAESGNAYSASRAAGEVSLGQVGNPSVGKIVPGALEVSNSDLGRELTSMITTQQSYSASSNVIRKINDLFEELRNL